MKNFSQDMTILNNELSKVKCDDIKVPITIVVFTYTQYKGSLRDKKKRTNLVKVPTGNIHLSSYIETFNTSQVVKRTTEICLKISFKCVTYTLSVDSSSHWQERTK